MDIKKRFWVKVRELRKKQWLSQQAFADKAWFHRTYISDIERWVKNVSLENIEKIALTIGVDIRKIF